MAASASTTSRCSRAGGSAKDGMKSMVLVCVTVASIVFASLDVGSLIFSAGESPPGPSAPPYRPFDLNARPALRPVGGADSPPARLHDGARNGEAQAAVG